MTELKYQKHTVNAIHYFRSGNVTETRTYLQKIDFRVSVVRIRNGNRCLYISATFTINGNTQFRPVRQSVSCGCSLLPQGLISSVTCSVEARSLCALHRKMIFCQLRLLRTGLTNRRLQMLITSLIICFSLSSRPLTASKTLVSKTYTERRYCKIDPRES